MLNRVNPINAETSIPTAKNVLYCVITAYIVVTENIVAVTTKGEENATTISVSTTRMQLHFLLGDTGP